MRRLIVVSLIMMLFASCSNKNEIKIITHNFGEEINRQQNLIFTFNRNIVPDTLLHQWMNTEFLQFKPEIKGQYKWINNNELLLSPEEILQPSTDYEVNIAREILDFDSKKGKINKDIIRFHTPYLTLEEASSYWTIIPQSSEIKVGILLKFNYPVIPENINKLLTIIIQDKESDFTIISKENNEQIEIQLPMPKLDPQIATPVKIIIGKGLACAESDYKTDKALELFCEIPAQVEIQITKAFPVLEKGLGSIHVHTSQPVMNKNCKELIRIKPELNYTIEKIPNGFILRGSFLEGQSYHLFISAKLEGIFGKTMKEDFSEYITFGNMEPSLEFVDKKSAYLSSGGEKNIGLNISSIPNVKITVFKIFENNIIHYLREGKRWSYMYHDDEWYDFTHYPLNENYGKEIYSKEIATNSLPLNGNLRLLNLNLEEIGYYQDLKGIYLIKAEDPEKKYLRDILMVSVSDIGFIVKKGLNHIQVFTNSILNAKALSGVKLSFISSNNQKVYTTSTNNNGFAELPDMENTIPGFNIQMITAELNNDFNFIIFNNSLVELSRYEVSGKYNNPASYDVFIYGDRDLYRPGEEVFFNTIVRKTHWETPEEMPLKIKVILPNGKSFINMKKTTGKEGSAEGSFRLPNSVMTGIFNIEVYSGNDVLLQSRSFQVEEFMPDRIKLLVKPDKEEYESGDKIKVDISAENFFGPPAAGRDYEIELKLNKKEFFSKKYPDFNFSISSSENMYFKNYFKEGKSDEEGTIKEEFVIPEYNNIGILTAKVFTCVFDETGRPVNRFNSMDYYTQKIFFGLEHNDYWVPTRKPLRMRVIALNKKEELLHNAKATVLIKRIYWETVVEKNGNKYVYNSQKREQDVYKKTLIISGNKSYISFTPAKSGYYEIRIMNNDSKNYVSGSFYAYGSGDTDSRSFEVDREGQIVIETEKDNYKPGERANILFKAPFSGQMLVCIERDNVVEHQYLQLKNKSASMSLSLKEEHIPNIYISATAIRPISQGGIPLTVAHGYKSVSVKDPDRKIEVEIDIPEKSRSKQKQKIRVKTIPDASVTIAVVDEGILQINNYKTPDPYGYYYAKKALEVRSYDIYQQIFPELSNSSSFAGGAAFELDKRNSPVMNNRIKLLSMWSGIMKSDKNGYCEYEIDIPQFSGTVRVMALAYKNNRFGSSEKNMKISDPIVISTALPRFLSPEDIASMPVILSNTSDKTIHASITVTSSGPVFTDISRPQNIEIQKNSEIRVEYKLHAKKEIGTAKVIVKVKTLQESFVEEIDISVRPAVGLTKISDGSLIKGGQSKVITVTSDFLEKGSSSQLIISSSPIAEFSKDLNYLVRYPYGCLEQTVSAAFPQLYFKDLIQAMNLETTEQDASPDYYIQQAIYKIESMQQYNGGLSYWPANSEVHWWSSIYAAHFLFEARKAGFQINEKILNNLLLYLKKRSKEKNKKNFYYYDANNVLQNSMMAQKETFYSLYVLALTNNHEISTMNYYKANLEEISLDSRYLLATTYALIGDDFSYKRILPDAFEGEKSTRMSGGCFSSYVRDMGISLNALLEADPNNKQIPILVNRLSKSLKDEHWLSTQERAFALLALGKYAKLFPPGKTTANITIDDKHAGTFSGKDLIIRENINNKKIKISCSGEGSLYYSYIVEGISASGKFPQEDNFLMVRKAFYDRQGNLLSGNTFSQNDLILVKIGIQSTDNKAVENVAITDLLPACFEIENPRLSAGRDMNWIKDQSYADYTDIRDDRISFFTDIPARQSRYFYYMVRAVSPGTYQMGPVSADAMYNGEYHSYHGAGKISVK